MKSTMKFSDAVELGRTLVPNFNPDQWNCCLGGMAVKAVQGAEEPVTFSKVTSNWPWLERNHLRVTLLATDLYYERLTWDEVLAKLRALEAPYLEKEPEVEHEAVLS